MSHSRPKPWEVSSGTSGASVGIESAGSIQSQPSQTGIGKPNSLVQAGDTAPEIPEKPDGLITGNGSLNQGIPNDNSINNNTNQIGDSYGLSTYGNGGLYGNGAYGSGMYGSGLYGGGMYGGGLYGGGMYGSGLGMYGSGGLGGPLGNSGLGGSLAQGTEATFQMIESFIGAIAGFAQMLESAYFATHNSFFTMMSVAEQFTHIKDALASVLGIYTVRGWIKKMIGYVKGSNGGLSIEEFERYQKEIKVGTRRENNGKLPKKHRASLKPLLFFIAAVFGMPYLLKKLVTIIAQNQQKQMLSRQQQQQNNLLAGREGLTSEYLASLDPKKLQFARAIYNFNPEDARVELALRKGDLVAVLSKLSPDGQESKWWKCRSRDGRLGFVPYNYLESIKRTKAGNKVVGVQKPQTEKHSKQFEGKKI